MALALPAFAENWPQASGPNLNWQADGPEPPLEWSVVGHENILWRTPLPEGGQSAVTVWGDRAFVTTHRPMDETSDRLEPNLVGYCLDANTGAILWTVDLPGTDPVQTAGIFSDATVFAPIADGGHVWFFNRCGSMGCFDFEGRQVWLREFRPRARHTNRECEPILVGDTILTVEVRNKEAARQLQRHQPVPEGIDPRDVWTYLHAIDKTTGEVRWVETAGTCIHNTPMAGQLPDGRWAIVHGRGGGHGPLEKPYGVSLSLLDSGETLWSREIDGDCSHNSHWNARNVFWFQGMNHLVLDTLTGEIVRTQDVVAKVDFTDSQTGRRETGVSIQAGKRMPLTNQTNLVVGDWHYFLAHDITAIGRVNVVSGKTEYLRVPAQWVAGPQPKKLWERSEALPNDTRNSRGIDIAPDPRAKGTGWGHVSAASPIRVNDHLFFPIMNGTVYVIDTTAETLDEKALVAINDLGPAGETWTLASFSYARGRLWMHTMKEVLCIGKN
ncbi:MAG: PQQ-binding-like beta-propeller repeat protein [Verrucomicrobiales bacterium]|nr:PQQ-binding-like beta-propeller repeat protein [Verrucomicrobiales bacterium]